MLNNKPKLSDYSSRLSKALESIDQGELDQLLYEISNRINTNSSIYILGNGGSHANAHHITGDFLKSFALAGAKIRISCLGDNICYLTAASNDLSYEEAYSLLVGTLIEPGDLIIYLSGSGNSINLVKCARKAKARKILQASVTSFNGGALKGLVDIPIYLVNDDMEIAEDVQLILFHYLKQNLLSTFDNTNSLDSLTKYKKRIVEDLVS